MVYTRKKYRKKRTIKRKRISISKRTIKRRTIRKQNRYLKKGGSIIYSVDENDTQYTDETYDGQSFFRKVYPENKFIMIGRERYPIGEANEKQIIEILMKHPEHPNIVKFFAIHDNSIDMEELETYATDEDYGDKNFTKKNKVQQVEDMRKAKDFLQSLGIMYMDWKFDNIGKAKDTDMYKLFDFDSSGLINHETNEWLLEPLHIKSYNLPAINEYKRRIGTADKPMTPKEMDDWSFEANILDQVGRM